MEFIGILYLFILFIASFCAVHLVRLIYLGLKSARTKQAKPEPQPEQQKKPEPPQPVYYIVEKKRAKRNYSKPREIEFKEQK